MIDKRISRSKKLSHIRDRSKVIYFMIYPHLDCEGRIAFDDIEDLKDECFPKFRYSLKSIAESLNELADVKLILLFPFGRGFALEFMRFKDFQIGLRKDREASSKIKAPTPVNSGVTPEYYGFTPSLILSLRLRSRLRKEGIRKEESPNGDSLTLEAKPISKSAEIKLKWNDFAEKHGLAKILGVKKGSKREKNLKARISEDDFDFDILLEMIEKSPFLLGKTKQEFFVTFDWIILPTNFQKIIEGNYIERHKGGGKFVKGGDW